MAELAGMVREFMQLAVDTANEIADDARAEGQPLIIVQCRAHAFLCDSLAGLHEDGLIDRYTVPHVHDDGNVCMHWRVHGSARWSGL